MKNFFLTGLSLLLILSSAQASALGYNCRNENPHIIADLELVSGNSTFEGTVIVGFANGVIACPLDKEHSSNVVECAGQYKLRPNLDDFKAKLVIRTNQIATLNLELPEFNGGQIVAVTCFQK